MNKILVIDNYDSFTYNLVHYLEDLGCEVVVKRNDQLKLEEVDDFEKIVLSPGPGIPDEAGLLKEIIAKYAPTKSIFGVCLGQQAIGEVFGGKLINLDEVYHGVATKIILENEEPLFEGLPREILVGRYHSWVVDPQLPDVLEATSFDENGQLMSLRHKTYDVCAVQFHPESVLTPEGKQILKNWLMD
ncbi:aminodeoxychorismate/anthranilate synthase component II [uncultured Eudoraea sp.]|uniref:anthranilate synthase component II n=1 Tax=uncultured Eudoraea sp. TaxID=1035614 RepID=UPI00262DAE98|nr:aminodeoxychorismate/anthranilate synthase component II [uncultured Eudoraea sp.]